MARIINLWVDESGSYNDKAFGNFQVAIFIVTEENKRKVIRKTKKFINQCRIHFNLKEEMKGHTLIEEKGLLSETIKYWESLSNDASYVASYYKNKGCLGSLDSNAMYNWMLKAAIQRGYDEGVILANDKIKILADKRGLKTEEKWQTEKYIKREFPNKIISLDYKDSEWNIEIFIADINTFLINRWVVNKNGFKWRIKINSKNIRKCY